MTDQTDPQDKKDALRMKIEASERRIQERSLAESAKEAADSAIEYTRQNPLTVVGGAIVVGLLIGLMTKPGRRAAGTAATGAVSAVTGAASGTARAAKGVTEKGANRFGTLVADSIVAYGMKFIDEALEGARAGQDTLEDIGDSATAKARQLRREASYMAGTAADKGRDVSRRTRRRAERAVRDLTGRTRS
jgi:ElaB/YqjD/DUF883 family membrane-anchored ribosome-binding protein